MSDHAEFLSACRRMLRAAGRRVADADPDDLTQLVALRGEVDAAIATAVHAMRDRGVPWQAIADVTHNGNRQSAHKRWAR